MPRLPLSSWIALILFSLLMGFLSLSMYLKVASKEIKDTRTDIRAQYEDAVLLSRGVNPYSRISNPDLPQDRLTFYLPGFLLGSTSFILLGADSYTEWLSGWRIVSIISHIAVGLLLLFLLLRHTFPTVAIIGSAFWFTSRWPLSLYRSGQIDSLAILFLLLSFLIWNKSKPASCLAFGVSLAIKQMAVFLFPLYLIWSWHEAKSNLKLNATISSAFYCLLVPAVISLPFIIWNFDDFVAMTLFPLGREASEPLPVHAFLGLEGIKRKLPFFAMLGLIYFEACKNRLTKEQQTTLILFAMISFTNAYFSRHFNWLIPFMLISVSQVLYKNEKRKLPTDISQVGS